MSGIAGLAMALLRRGRSGRAPVGHRAVLVRHLLAGLALMLATPALAQPGWFGKPYGYVVIDQDVRAALTEFGRNLQLPVVMSEAVHGRIRGEVRADKAGAFLDLLAGANGLTWYYDGAVLNVSADSEYATRVLDTGRLTAKAVVAQMRQLGLADDRFALRPSTDGRVMSVSGPPAYVAAVDQLIQRMQPAPVVAGDDPRVRVFRGGMVTEVVTTQDSPSPKP